MMVDTKEKILEAGLTIFSAKGYVGSSTREIAKKAGVAEITLFRHFSSKETLFGEVIKSYTFLPILKKLIPNLLDKDYKEALEDIARNYLEKLEERKDLIQIMKSKARLYPEKVANIHRAYVDEMFKTMASYFRQLQESKKLREDFDPEMGALAFVGMLFTYFSTREFFQRKDKISDTNKVIKEFVEIFVKGTVQ